MGRPSPDAGPAPALVHDYLLVMRGAERTFAEMAACYPGAPVYTLLYDAEGTAGRFADRRVTTSPLQRLGVRQTGFRALAPLFPAAAGRLPVGGHDLVVSSSSAFAHGVPHREDAVHVCYCHSPFRYAWFEQQRALGEIPAPARPAMRAYLAAVRRWDRSASRRVTRYVANSEHTRRRIEEVWNRDAGVVYPPVSVDRFAPGEPGERLLIVCELVRHKRVDIALQAARMAGRGIDVVGTGPEREALEARFGGNARFLGRIDDARLAAAYQQALAFVLPNVEEFGIAAVEAQAAGRPVVAVDDGGARETVVPGETGVLVEPDVDSIAEALRDTDFTRFDPARIRANAERFSPEGFRRAFSSEVDAAVSARA